MINERTKLVSQNSEAGKPTNHLDTREAAMGNFSNYYKNEIDRLVITAFWDNRQDPKKLVKLLRK